MEQIGTVMKTEENKAYVVVNRVSACGENCAHCKGGCTPTSVLANAQNLVGANVGDTVKLESDTKRVIFAAFILYMLPVLVAIFTAIFISSITPRTALLAIASAGAFFVTFFIIKRFEKKLTPTPVITKIIKPKE